MGPLQVRQDMLRHSIPWCDLPQYGALRTAMVVRAASGYQTIAHGAALKQGKGIRVMAVVVDFEANEPHGFEGVEERVQHLWVCAQRAWVGERAYAPGLRHQSKGFLSAQSRLGDITGVAAGNEGLRQVRTGQRAAGTLQHALCVQRGLPILYQERVDALQHLHATLDAVLLRQSQLRL